MGPIEHTNSELYKKIDILYKTLEYRDKVISDLTSQLTDCRINLDQRRIEMLQYRNLREYFQSMINDTLGKDYYNMGMDVYECDRLCCRDVTRKVNESILEKVICKIDNISDNIVNKIIELTWRIL